VEASINSFTQATGVTASLINGNAVSGLRFSSQAYGSDAFVSVKRIGGPATGDYFQTYQIVDNGPVPQTFSFDTIAPSALSASNRDAGRDVQAIVNGTLGSGRGLKLSIQNTTSLSLELM